MKKDVRHFQSIHHKLANICVLFQLLVRYESSIPWLCVVALYHNSITGPSSYDEFDGSIFGFIGFRLSPAAIRILLPYVKISCPATVRVAKKDG